MLLSVPLRGKSKPTEIFRAPNSNALLEDGAQRVSIERQPRPGCAGEAPE
jgi:hypothetical protein